jgi:hypothetical protein
MGYSTSEARQQLLDTLAEATDALGYALACLAEAYDKLDEHNGERLEEELFHPVQVAYGRAKATHSGFAGSVTSTSTVVSCSGTAAQRGSVTASRSGPVARPARRSRPGP